MGFLMGFCHPFFCDSDDQRDFKYSLKILTNSPFKIPISTHFHLTGVFSYWSHLQCDSFVTRHVTWFLEYLINTTTGVIEQSQGWSRGYWRFKIWLHNFG